MTTDEISPLSGDTESGLHYTPPLLLYPIGQPAHNIFTGPAVVDEPAGDPFDAVVSNPFFRATVEEIKTILSAQRYGEE